MGASPADPTTGHQQRVAASLERRAILSKNSSLEKKVETLELELGQASLVIEALVQRLESANILTRDELAEISHAIDAADGVIDGRVTPESNKPFVPKKSWDDAKQDGRS